MAKANAKPRGGRRNRDAEIVEAAIDVFWRKGYPVASVQDVADQVGVLKGSLYHYIDTKEDLLFRIFDESHTQASAIVKEVSELDVTPIERLRIYVERYVEWYIDNLERVSLYYSEWRHLTGKRRTTVLKQRHFYEDFMRETIREAQAAGEVPAGLNATFASFFILGGIQNIPVWYRRDGAESPKQIAAAFAAMTLGMLTGTGPQPAKRARAR